ncbi:hypothetical protein BCh11DRAFT_04634 [Burkholderia sp. Ch1-1]|nr:hypothetical protein BCh11DRAFT_04634 [Burkholderia sp. Ch1-1]
MPGQEKNETTHLFATFGEPGYRRTRIDGDKTHA